MNDLKFRETLTITAYGNFSYLRFYLIYRWGEQMETFEPIQTHRQKSKRCERFSYLGAKADDQFSQFGATGSINF
jgi:hypothetical protein